MKLYEIHGNGEIPQLFYTCKLQREANSVLSLWPYKPSLKYRVPPSGNYSSCG